MNSIRYYCPSCETNIEFRYNQIPVETASALPSPTISSMNFQDHGDHTVFFNIEEQEIKRLRIIPQVYSIFDMFLSDNMTVSNIVNTILSNHTSETTNLLLFLSPPASFTRFSRELASRYIQSSYKVKLISTSDLVLIELSHLVFIICNIESGQKIMRKGSKAFPVLNQYNSFFLRSLVIDTSNNDEKSMIRSLKKVKLSSSIRTILAFDTRKQSMPPLDLREFLLEKYDLNNLEVLNYQDTNGLKSILLQSFYNVLDNPIEARDVFELTRSH